MTVNELYEWIKTAVFWASLVLVGMMWLEGLLEIWIGPKDDRRFWRIYGKLEKSVEYVAASREAWGKRFLEKSRTAREESPKE